MTTIPPVLDALSLNRYHLKIKGCTTPLDVESFHGREGLSTRYRYDVELTSADKDINPSTMLMKNVTFIMQTLPETAFRHTIAPEVQRTLYGIITHFSRLSVSNDEATYRLTFEPRFSLLDNTRRSAIYQNMSVPEVVEKILREYHSWPGWLFEFRLSNTWPQREIITQFMLSDAEFISRLLSEVGIWFSFTQDRETGHEVVLFGDSEQGWQYGVSVPAVNPAGMHDNRAEAVWNLQAHHQVTERSVSTHDYNYRTADAVLNADADLTHDDDKTTYGNDYHYTDGFLSEGERVVHSNSKSTESGYFYARLRHERQLNRQHRLSLESNSTLIAPGQILKADGDTCRAFANGMLVTTIESSASRQSHYRLKAEGIAYRVEVIFRPAYQPRARITVPLTARITSSQSSDIYSHIDKQGRYRVRFDFDKESWPQGGESPWLRRARDYAGDNVGLHLPLIQGTEVAVMFDGGHPDISLLWPHYLRPLPSMCVVEIAPEPDALKHSDTVAMHTEVVSAPVGNNRVCCRYRTTRALTLQPLALTLATVFSEPDGTSALRLRFQCGNTADWRRLDLSALPVYLNGDAPLASLLHLYLTRRVAQAFIRMPGHVDRESLPLRFRASAFDADAHLWDVEKRQYSGYQHLLEYFTFREKFMFVSLEGLEQIAWPETLPWFELELRFTQSWPRDFTVSEENLRLHCVPVVNLFRLDARPLAINAHQTEYPLQPLRNDDPHTEIFAVESVATSFEEDAPHYMPFLLFQQQGGMLKRERPPRYFHTRVQRGPSGRTETRLILGGEEFERERLLPDEILALSLLGTNGSLPRMILKSVLLCKLAGTQQTPLRVRNLCQPSLPCYPPIENRFHWKLLSQLGSSFLWMMDDAEVLRNTLALYDWTGSDSHDHRLRGIIKVEHHRLEYWKRGLQRGVEIEVTLDTTRFAGEGDVWLFGSLLNRFFAQYADMHLFNRLTLILQPTGHCLRWKENPSSASPR